MVAMVMRLRMGGMNVFMLPWRWGPRDDRGGRVYVDGGAVGGDGGVGDGGDDGDGVGDSCGDDGDEDVNTDAFLSGWMLSFSP